MLEIEGQLYTPPAHLPLLDGIYRRHLLETQQVEEKLLTLNDLTDADRIYACNALRRSLRTRFSKKGFLMKLIFFTWTRARCPLLARSPICTFTLALQNF